MMAAGSSEMFIRIYKTTKCYKPDEHSIDTLPNRNIMHNLPKRMP
jgi:hypothetical protein